MNECSRLRAIAKCKSSHAIELEGACATVKMRAIEIDHCEFDRLNAETATAVCSCKKRRKEMTNDCCVRSLLILDSVVRHIELPQIRHEVDADRSSITASTGEVPIGRIDGPGHSHILEVHLRCE